MDSVSIELDKIFSDVEDLETDDDAEFSFHIPSIKWKSWKSNNIKDFKKIDEFFDWWNYIFWDWWSDYSGLLEYTKWNILCSVQFAWQEEEFIGNEENMPFYVEISCWELP
jgi:hypothetical protein